MSDDGSGAGLTTPALLIGKADGEKLKKFIKEDKRSIILNSQFVMEHKEDHPEVGFWYTSSNDKALDFLKNIGEYIKPIVGSMDFEPKFVHWHCKGCEAKFK